MAGKNLGPTFEAIMRDLEARKFSPIYILMGEEPYYIDKISDFVAENALDESERDFNQTILFGSDVNASIISVVCTGRAISSSGFFPKASVNGFAICPSFYILL